MLIYAVIAITLAILVGIGMASQILQKKPFHKGYSFLHLGLVLLGALFTIIAALSGGVLLWWNIGLAVIVSLLGFMLAFRLVGQTKAIAVLAIHAGLALSCYLFLAYNTFS